MYKFPVASTATAFGLMSCAPVADPPSKREVPPPATVVMMTPETLRMRLLFRSAIYRLPETSTAKP